MDCLPFRPAWSPGESVTGFLLSRGAWTRPLNRCDIEHVLARADNMREESHGPTRYVSDDDRARPDAWSGVGWRSVAHKVTLSLGVVLLIAGVAGRVILPEHRPVSSGGSGAPITLNEALNPLSGSSGVDTTARLSHTLYDVLRITTWGLLIVGTVVISVGLINYARRPRPTSL